MIFVGTSRDAVPAPDAAAESMVSRPPSASRSPRRGRRPWQILHWAQAGPSTQRGSIHPLIPASFSSALMQLFGQPETPILNLCGAGFP